ncbi:MAG: radical SAM protein [Myxococcales bacterium]|nr:radical SAM protein [Myxococcales bacterium]MCB9577299.1 radical SAM protein [Polyangiaceae bacterium]
MNAISSALEVTKQLLGARFRWQHPVYLVHALTARCNARCGFCAWNPEFYDGREQLSTEAIQQLYTDARRAGFIGLSIWGGEPLLHHDFDEIVAHAAREGLISNMITNGFLLEKKMDPVVEHVDRVCISLDHPSDKHDELRRIRGLFDKIVSATRELKRRAPDKTVVFICTLQKANVDRQSVRGLAELAKELGVLVLFNGLREEAATDGDTHLDAYAPSDAQLSDAFRTVAELKRQGYPILNSHTHLDMMMAGPPVYRCHWPKFMLPVEANGDVVDCMHWGTRPVGNLKQTPFEEILKSPRLRELAGPAGEGCHKCVSIHRVEISEVCSGNLEPVRSWIQLRVP